MKRAQEEIAARQPHVTFYALLILAALFGVDAAGTLLWWWWTQACERPSPR